jgi:NAD dependent epimerase/dehydratase
MKILVTGADGFIGSHLVERLVREGHEVRALVLYNSFNSWGWLDSCDSDVRGKFEVVSGDIRDPHSVAKFVKGVDSIMHLAALIAIPYSYVSPGTYVDTNVIGTLNLLQAAIDCNVKGFIQASTSEVYGTAKFVPITEDHPQLGQSPYSATKIAADQLAHSFYASFGLPLTIIRPFNTYGPRQSMRAVIPTIVTQIASGKKNISLGSTLTTRDFSFVDDTVSGFVTALNVNSNFGEVYNLGSGFEISIGDVVLEISRILQTEISVKIEEDRIRPVNSEVERLLSDNSKARNILGWEPVHAGLDGFRDGLIKTVEWFTDLENLRGYRFDEYNL